MHSRSPKIPVIDVKSFNLIDAHTMSIAELTSVIRCGSELHMTIGRIDIKQNNIDRIDHAINNVIYSVTDYLRGLDSFKHSGRPIDDVMRNISRDLINYFKSSIAQFNKDTNQIQLDFRVLVSKDDINLKKSYIDRNGKYTPVN